VLADYFERAALAASQVLAGFELKRFRARLEEQPVGLSVGDAALELPEGRHLADLTVRLLARLYPAIELRAGTGGDDLAALALAINPAIELVAAGATTGIAIGDRPQPFPTTVHAGSDGWTGLLSSRPASLGKSRNPLGPGVAACLAAGALFRHVFLPHAPEPEARFSAIPDPRDAPNDGWVLDGDAVLVGAGAIGHGALWALARAKLDVTLHIVDHESLELGNLQRYVLATRADDGAAKAALAAQALRGPVRGVPHTCAWDEFVGRHGYRWEHVLLALDSAADRRAVQSSLPGWEANAWTQPGDLGISCHGRFDGPGACVACLYLQGEPRPNQDELVATALGVPQLAAEIRTLLHSGGPVTEPLLAQIAAGLGLDVTEVLRFSGRPIRSLYVEGICGGALIPMGRAGAPADADLHVPLAHQSVFAGVLLAAQLVRRAMGRTPETTEITRLDVLGDLAPYPTQPALKAGDGRCLCEDEDFLAAWRAKYAAA